MRSFLYRGGLVAKDKGVPRQFLRVVRDGGAVATLADLRDYTGVSVPFLGRPAPTTTFPALLAVSAGSPVLVCCMRRLPGVRFVQSFSLVPLPDSGDRAADVVAVTAAIQSRLGDFIGAWPEQWMWAHRRWG
jgi:KDO2-lipid IV(A) lauroyltransferase